MLLLLISSIACQSLVSYNGRNSLVNIDRNTTYSVLNVNPMGSLFRSASIDVIDAFPPVEKLFAQYSSALFMFKFQNVGEFRVTFVASNTTELSSYDNPSLKSYTVNSRGGAIIHVAISEKKLRVYFIPT